MPEEPESLLFGRLKIYEAAALGSAIATWAQFEFEVDELIWALAYLEEKQGACLTAQYSTVAQRFDALLSLAVLEKVPEKHIKRLNAVRARALAIAQTRNRLVHDAWFYAHESGTHFRLNKTAKSRLDYSYKPVTEADLKAIEKEFLDLIAKFWEAKYALLKDFRALPDTPAPKISE